MNTGRLSARSGVDCRGADDPSAVVDDHRLPGRDATRGNCQLDIETITVDHPDYCRHRLAVGPPLHQTLDWPDWRGPTPAGANANKSADVEIFRRPDRDRTGHRGNIENVAGATVGGGC